MAGTLLLQPGLCEAADPFYERRKEEGVLAYNRGDYSVAARDLRVACFGMLDEPAMLAACLVHLALAQAALEDREAFDGTVLRIAEVERRFEGYSSVEMAAATRRVFEQQLRRWVEADRLEALLGIGREAGEVAPGIEGSPAEPPVDPSLTAAPRLAPRVEVLAQNGGSDEVAIQLQEARRLLASSDDRLELSEIFAALRSLVDRYPEHRELSYVTAEVAYRLSSWAETIEYFRRPGLDGPVQPDRRFYLAVALYENGDRAAALEALERCLPQLQQTDFVRGYAARIRRGSELGER